MTKPKTIETYEEAFSKARWMSDIIGRASEGDEDALEQVRAFILAAGEMVANLGTPRDLVEIARFYFQLHKHHIENQLPCSPPNAPLPPSL